MAKVFPWRSRAVCPFLSTSICQLPTAISHAYGTGPRETVLLFGVMLVLPSEPQT